jgi:hypothetical protein
MLFLGLQEAGQVRFNTFFHLHKIPNLIHKNEKDSKTVTVTLPVNILEALSVRFS